ncbi:hypothetical protein BGZ72_006751 [Mortierella alpina]|nr:hypothetical protein BGZ72_006751 [Mortierella alpina]
MEALQRKLQVAEGSIAELTTKNRATDMLNTQLTEKARATDKLETELADARKSLAKANKDRDQANRKLSESREAMMKMEAEKMSRVKWLEGEKKKWEEEQQTRLVGLQDQIKELQEEVEDLKENGHGDEMAVDFLEASMIKDELAEVKAELEQKIDQLRSKTIELEETARQLREAKETIEDMKVTIEALEQNQTDDFEEVIPGQKSTGSAAATLHPEASTKERSLSVIQPPQAPRPDQIQLASPDQMNSALRTLDDLKSQFSILNWTHDSKASTQTIATLETKVIQLTKEKEALQQELLQRVMTPPTALETKIVLLTKEKEALQQELLQRVMTPPTAQETKIAQLTKEKEALQQELLQRIMAPPPVNLETRVLQLTKEKEALQQELVQRFMAPPAQATHQPVDSRPNGSAVAQPSTLHQVPEKQLANPNDKQMFDLTVDMDIDLSEPEPSRSRNRSSTASLATSTTTASLTTPTPAAVPPPTSLPTSTPATPLSTVSKDAGKNADAVHPLDMDDGLQVDWDDFGPTQPVPGPSTVKPSLRKSVTASSSTELPPTTRTAPLTIFLPRSTSPKKLGKKASAPQPTNLINEKQANLSEAGGSKPAARKLAKPRPTKKTTNSKIDISQLEIRNISTNPFIPCISHPDIYFSVLMNSPIVHDSQPNTKLSTMATVLPQKLDLLFECVYAKAKEITPKVAAFRTTRDIQLDDTKEWTLEGQAPIRISESLSPNEIYIVQLLCVLSTHFHQMNIIPNFFAFAHDKTIKDARANDLTDTLSVFLRVVTGVCRAQGDLNRATILAFDLLREIQGRGPPLILSEAMASIWPAVFTAPRAGDASDRQLFMSKAIQAVVGTMQDEINEEQIVLAHGYDTFVIKCNWPTLDEAPYVDELAEELMATIQEPEYAQTSPEVQFAHRKALELLLVQGYSWAEIFEKYIKTHIIKMLADPEKRITALTLLAAVMRSFYQEAVQCLPLRQILDGILTEEANGVVIL